MPGVLPEGNRGRKGKRRKNIQINLADSGKSSTFARDFDKIACEDGLHLSKKRAFCIRFAPSLHPKVDPLAQSVEHNTFNVGVLGSSPKRITKKNPQEVEYQ